ncbi:MAG: hypothetical protein A2Y25_06490 [Candidatus Melainabacteria bacterium GWF2_37_15]|nr:MAG: hypothetical protein A2Y25_06490 [Candidatus Melainabacteria bacterium GWF2_37_15]
MTVTNNLNLGSPIVLRETNDSATERGVKGNESVEMRLFIPKKFKGNALGGYSVKCEPTEIILDKDGNKPAKALVYGSDATDFDIYG